ncbi:CoA ester lyase [Amycolatopsis sp. GM8]|uniref:HpcH/HpaI aldolase/citrate lyase family protein n=1 Tax=Amycolatopsis sp. GM8 TaxID=2896530 RepID=UPI001F329EC5|nr:CoA ester lyase [Amycolatopsis sp. GM8]
MRRRRSELVTPATSERMITKALGGPADVLILDLEDAVSPERKHEARVSAARALTRDDWGTRGRAVRINPPGGGLALDDLRQVVGETRAALDFVVIPKVVAPRDVWWVDTTLTEIERGLGLDHRVGIEVLIEDVAAMPELTAIAASSPRVEALAFGPGDFSASQHLDLDAAGNDREDLYPGDVWHHVRSAIAIAARIAGVAAIDGAYADLRNADGYRRECVRSRTLGFDGKWAIHPDQVAVANDVYTPGPEAVEQARAVLDAYQAATRDGAGAAAHNGHLIDAATLRAARQVVAASLSTEGNS